MRLSFLPLVVCLSACTAVQLRQPMAPRKLPPAPDITSLQPAEKPNRKELGSLWSEASSWNSVYSTEENRRIGDIIPIKIDAKLRSQIQRELEAHSAPPPQVAATTGFPPAVGEPPRRPAAAPEAQSEIKVRGIIQSIPAQGIYRVTVADMVKIGSREPYIYLEGNLREADLDAGRGTSSDSLLNLRLEVYGEDDVKAANEYEQEQRDR